MSTSNNTPKLDIGVVVVVVFVENPEYGFLYGQVGTIIEKISGVEALITRNEWIVDFPDTRDYMCPHCHRSHGSRWPMRSIELRPLHDPDQATETERVETQPLNEEISA
jgi:hypothetical protein